MGNDINKLSHEEYVNLLQECNSRQADTIMELKHEIAELKQECHQWKETCEILADKEIRKSIRKSLMEFAEGKGIKLKDLAI